MSRFVARQADGALDGASEIRARERGGEFAAAHAVCVAGEAAVVIGMRGHLTPWIFVVKKQATPLGSTLPLFAERRKRSWKDLASGRADLGHPAICWKMLYA
jgi:hypothetical protein